MLLTPYIDQLNEEITKAINESRVSTNDVLVTKFIKELNESIKVYQKLKEDDKNKVLENIKMLTTKLKQIKKVDDVERVSISVNALNKVLKEDMC